MHTSLQGQQEIEIDILKNEVSNKVWLIYRDGHWIWSGNDLPLSSVIIMIIILSRGLIQLARTTLRTRYLPVKASSEHCCLLKGLCQTSPLPTPLVFFPQAWATHPLLRQSLGYPAVPTKMARPLHFWTPGWPGARLCLVPGENLVATF